MVRVSRRDSLLAALTVGVAVIAATVQVKVPGIALVAVAIVYLYFMPRWLPLALALGAAWTRVLVPDVFPAGLQIADVALGVFVARWVIEQLQAPMPTRLPSPAKWLIAFFAWAWLAMVLNHGTQVPALARMTLYGATFLAASTTRGLSRPTFIFASLVSAGQVVAAAVGAALLGPGMTGFVGDPHQFGLLGMAGLAGAQFAQRPWLRRALSAASLLAIVLSFRRGIWIGGVVEGGVILVVRGRTRTQRILAALAVSGFLAAVVFGFQEALTPELRLNAASFALRQETWRTGIELVRASPIFGNGWSDTLPVAAALSPYNLWLNVAGSLGVPGALLLTAFFVSLVWTLMPGSGRESNAVLAYLLGFLTLSMAEMTFYSAAPGTIAFFVLMGAAAGEFSMARHLGDVGAGVNERGRAKHLAVRSNRA